MPSLTYTGAEGICTQIGKMIDHVNDLETLIDTTWPAKREAITDDLAAASNPDNRDAIIGSVNSIFESSYSFGESVRTNMLGAIFQRLSDRVTVLDPLHLQSANRDDILRRFFDAMVDDDVKFTASTATVGSVTADGGNTGTGTVSVTSTLDGVTPPGSGMIAYRGYDGLTSQLVVKGTDTVRVECIGDSKQSGQIEGGEQFRVSGLRSPSIFDSNSLGSGPPISIRVMNGPGENILTNGDFEAITSNVPDGWDAASGTAGTHVIGETTAADVFRNDSAIRFDGDGSQASIALRQYLTGIELIPLRRYALTFYYKASAVPAAGNLVYTVAADSQTIATGNVAAASLATSYTRVVLEFSAPATVNDNPYVYLDWQNTPSSSRSLYLDSVALAPVPYYGGVGLILTAGATPYSNGDYFTFDLSNDEAGAWQTFWKRFFGFQMRTTGTTTIADGLIA